MKKKFITLAGLVLCLVANQAHAQIRLPEQKAIQINAGLTDGFGFIGNRSIAYYAGIALSHYTGNGNKWLYGVEYFEKHYCYKCKSIPVAQFTAEGGYYYNFLSNRGKDIFFSAGLSALAGYETSNWGKKTFPDGATLQSKDGFIWGGAVTLEIETFVYDRLAVLLNIRERFLSGSDIGNFHTQVGIGIKYIYK